MRPTRVSPARIRLARALVQDPWGGWNIWDEEMKTDRVSLRKRWVCSRVPVPWWPLWLTIQQPSAGQIWSAITPPFVWNLHIRLVWHWFVECSTNQNNPCISFWWTSFKMKPKWHQHFFCSFKNNWVITSHVESIKSICTLPEKIKQDKSAKSWFHHQKGLYPRIRLRTLGLRGERWRAGRGSTRLLMMLHPPAIGSRWQQSLFPEMFDHIKQNSNDSKVM